CMLESGFMCQSVPQDDAVDCTQPANMTTAGAKCLELPIVYRDFKNESVSGGHPDFFYMGFSPIANPVSETGVAAGMTYPPTGTQTVNFNKRYCVPNSGGPAKKNDSTNRCWDIAQANLANG